MAFTSSIKRTTNLDLQSYLSAVQLSKILKVTFLMRLVERVMGVACDFSNKYNVLYQIEHKRLKDIFKYVINIIIKYV